MAKFKTLAPMLLLLGCSGGGDDKDEQPISSAGTTAAGTGGTNSAGTGGTEPTGGTGGTEPAMCLEPGDDCSGNDEACCDGTTCVYGTDAPTVGTCATICSADADCASGCCAELIDGPGAVCAPTNYCQVACFDAGESCASNVDGCCPDHTCIDGPDGILCAGNCDMHTDCNSGCCAPLSNSDQFVCSRPELCL